MKQTRLEQALAIRDHLLPLISERGEIREMDGSTRGVWYVSLKLEPFSFLLRTPNTRWNLTPPDAPPGVVVLPWCLDVYRGPKVLSLQWGEADRADIIGFRRGPWEAEALALGGAAERAAERSAKLRAWLQ